MSAPLTDYKRRLGVAIAQRRRAAGLSQAELAVACGASQATVSRIERGEGNPDVVLLRAIAASVGVEAGTLLGDAEAIVPCATCGGGGPHAYRTVGRQYRPAPHLRTTRIVRQAFHGSGERSDG